MQSELCSFSSLFSAPSDTIVRLKPLTSMNTPSAQTYTAGGRAIPPRESFQRQRGIHRERLRVPQRISSTPARLRPIREAENEPPVRPEPHRHHLIMPSPSIEPMIKDPPRPQTPPPELDIPHEGYMLLELKTNVKVCFSPLLHKNTPHEFVLIP